MSLADLLSKIVSNELPLSTLGRVLDESMLKIDGFFEDTPKILNLPSFHRYLLYSQLKLRLAPHLKSVESKQFKAILSIIKEIHLHQRHSDKTQSVEGKRLLCGYFIKT